MSNVVEIKQALRSAGFEVYRTAGDAVHVAERVRDNLLMDSGVRVRTTSLVVSFVVRAQHSDFPREEPDALFQRARELAGPALSRGFAEVGANVTPIPHPSDAAQTLDTWCEVVFEKPVSGLAEALTEVGFALALEKAATPP